MRHRLPIHMRLCASAVAVRVPGCPVNISLRGDQFTPSDDFDQKIRLRSPLGLSTIRQVRIMDPSGCMVICPSELCGFGRPVSSSIGFTNPGGSTQFVPSCEAWIDGFSYASLAHG